ncbi:Metallothionein expression activator [Didymella pomorum]|uniref:Metallothionein expression activator n=1 Tax=Didymella pomorum TaxID=749634 RepID=A0A9W8ZCR0_9PLEO|nr:Metallothionein expression activator [Didymella pomorum]
MRPRHNRSGMSLDLRGLNLESNHAASPGPYQQEHAPTEQQLKDLHEHIQSVYGSCGQVFINILPTPNVAAAPQAVIPEKPAQLPSHQSFGMAPHPTNFNDMADINLRPTSRSMGFDYEHPDHDGYESPGSVYYGSDVSPSPQASPRMRMPQPFLHGITEDEETTPFSHMPTLLPALEPHSPVHGSSPIHAIPNGLPLAPSPYDEVALAPSPYDEVPLYNDLEIDATVEFTGISSEEVQRYISEQDPKTNKWTCLYQDCGKIFGRRENIRSHVQTHLGDRQYKCNGCGKCFVRQHDLKRHAKIHSGNKPYKCPCGAGFARQDALTRHRQRGMCVGGFADAVRRQAKRGRPKKQRPEMEERVAKSSRTRRALASAASSEAGSSPPSDGRSPYESFEAPLQNFNEPLNASTDPFSFEPQSSPYHETDREEEFARAASYTSEAASINLLRQLSNEPAQTPPLSPGYRHLSREPILEPVPERKQSHQPSQPSPLKVTESPSRSSVKSQGFTTPPTSPIEPQDELEELFDIRQEPSLSQFDLEMRAMSDFTAVDNNNYDFLDFSTV